MKDSFGFIKLVFKIFWLAILCVSSYFIFYYEIEDYSSEMPDKFEQKEINEQNFEILNMSFYYTDGNKLIREDRKIRLSHNPLVLSGIVLDEYFKGPENSDLFNVIPEKVTLRNYFLSENVLYIDLSREVRSNFQGGILPELLFIYGIANTVCQIDAVKSVKFLINGEDTDVLISHIMTSGPVNPDEMLLQKY
ncbi:MAG: GerMN domain-containing protein [Candidatus Muirbacterium halophilum]|nr:GerMN domain-containing protein [Candidatus Muirbacterium halophilum]MCK9474392.1 GerMN domain-containing protein [Candidatus Muirbacterium halophilum]